MTVISAIKFNQHSGAVVADEISIVGNKQYFLSTKLHPFENNESFLSIIGGTGTLSIVHEVREEIINITEKERESIKTTKEFVQYIEQAMKRIKEKHIQRIREFELSEADSWEGSEKLPKELNEFITKYLKKKTNQAVKHIEDINEYFLALSREKRGIKIDLISFLPTKTYPIAWPFKAIGSGREEAENELNHFFDTLTREQREDINPHDGLSALLWAHHQANFLNRSVGGIPLIYVINDNKNISNQKIISPCENNSKLAQQIVQGVKEGYLPPEFGQEALEALVYKEEDFRVVRAELKKQKNWEQLDLRLNGYRL